MVTLVPLPSSLATVSLPRCASTSLQAIGVTILAVLSIESAARNREHLRTTLRITHRKHCNDESSGAI